MYKINKPEIKKVITREEKYRKELEQRRTHYMLMSMSKMGATIMSIQRGAEFGKQFETDLPKEKIDKAIEQLKPCIKYSQWKEKFYRYAYNKDYDNMKKYSEKCSKYENESLDELMDDCEGVAVQIDRKLHDKENQFGKGEEAFRLIANEYKNCYDARKDLLSIVLLGKRAE